MWPYLWPIRKRMCPTLFLRDLASSQERKNLPTHYFPFSGLRHLAGTRAVCIMACLISLICLVHKPSGLHPKWYSHVLPKHTWPEAEEHFLQCGWGRPASYGWLNVPWEFVFFILTGTFGLQQHRDLFASLSWLCGSTRRTVNTQPKAENASAKSYIGRALCVSCSLLMATPRGREKLLTRPLIILSRCRIGEEFMFGLQDNNDSLTSVRRPQFLSLSFIIFAHFSSELYKHRGHFLRNHGGKTDALTTF